MEKDQRNALRNAVVHSRRLLEKEFQEQLEGNYNILSNGRVLEGAPGDPIVRARLLEVIQHHRSNGATASEAVDRVVREAAFTVLNRFAALKMAERRELVRECVSQGLQSQGIRELSECAPGLRGALEDGGYRLLLDAVMDEISLDLKVLFDRRDSMAPLWPGPKALDDLLETLNVLQLADVWAEDEAIGWVYQYFNDNDVKEMRDATKGGAPRNSRELAVRNQFFTPRYVVEFLVDNTLGRLWYDMTRGETVLRDRCRYLVRRPAEIFLNPGESAPESDADNEAKTGESLSQEDLLRRPVHIPHRPLKDPREIRLLDPACGSMHFGLYAFDLFTVIYDEAWEIAYGRDDDAKSAEAFAPFAAFAAAFPDKAAFLREVPRLIVERNLHGIDIDPRAAQIAGLSLWLRAQRAWHQAGVKPADRPGITRSNLVCAEPMPGENELLREFVEQQFVAGERSAFAFLLEKIFDRMTLAGEAGSLLHIEEEIRTAIANAKQLWRQGPKQVQASLFSEPAEKARQGELHLDLSGITDEQFWERAEQRIYEALEAYSEQTENGAGFRRRLFADDAAQGFAFIDLCRKRYDVVVMNPPFGEQTEALKAYLASQYPRTKTNLYCTFVERAYSYCPAGRVGLISARTFVMYRDFEGFREEFLLNSARIEAFADLGWEVLDGAQVETAALVLARLTVGTEAHQLVIGPFIKLLDIGLDLKGETLLRACKDTSAFKDAYFVRRTHFSALPGSPLAYWASPKLVTLFSESATFEPSLAYCGRGAAAHVFFFRLAWEVPSDQSANLSWRRLAHGGEYSPFFRENSVFIYWKDSGRQVKEYILKQYPYLNGNFGWAIQDEEKYGRVGLTSGKRNERFNVQLMPAGHIFTNEGQGFIPNRIEDVWFCLGYLNSSLVSYFLALTSGLQKTWVYIRPVPVVSLDPATREVVDTSARESFEIKRKWTAGAEEGALFIRPWALSGVGQEPIEDGLRTLLQRHADDSEAINQRRTNLSSSILAALNLDPNDAAEVEGDFQRHPADVAFPAWRGSDDDEIVRQCAARTTSYLVGCVFGRWDIRYATGERPAPELPDPCAPLPVCPPGMLQGDDDRPLALEAGRRLRAEGRYPLDLAWDGILVDDPEHPLDIVSRVHSALVLLWGERADLVEHELCALIDVPNLREWFRHSRGFFADHLQRYSKSRRKAPIYWPLSTESGAYTIWLYYHRITSDTLFHLVAEFLEPKLRKTIEERLQREAGQAKAEGRESAKLAKQADELLTLQHELEEMKAELLRVAELAYKPDLNDGVQITAAPLWKLFRFPKWRKELETTWKKLEKGEYDWAHLAYAIWPNRVSDKCKTDRSLAIAHGLEVFSETEVAPKKQRRSKGTT